MPRKKRKRQQQQAPSNANATHAHTKDMMTPPKESSSSTKKPKKSEGQLSDRIKSMGFMNRNLEAQQQKQREEEERKRLEEQKWSMEERKKPKKKSKTEKSRFIVVTDNTTTALPREEYTARRSFSQFNRQLESLKQERARTFAHEAGAEMQHREQVGDEELAKRYETYVRNREPVKEDDAG